eukprot:3299504-Prymnesium_polylepis.1
MPCARSRAFTPRLTKAESSGVLGGAWAVEPEEIEWRSRLGAGAFGEVYDGKWRRSRVAIKRLHSSGRWQHEEDSVLAFLSEMDILSNARHPNI